MLKANNSNPAACVNNLLRTARGEVPYDRIKGVSSATIGAPASQSSADLITDTKWMLGVYEPRAEVESLDIIPTDGANGHFTLQANIKSTKEA